jgi:hypothetical protein
MRSAKIWQGCERSGEAVDDWHACRRCEVDDVLVIVGADHHRIDHAREHARGVFDSFAAAELGVVGVEHNGFAAKLMHADSNETRVRVEFFWKIMARA